MKMKKWTKGIHKTLGNMIDILIHIFAFTLLTGLIFDDLFGVLGNITNILNNLSDNGMSALIGLFFVYTYVKNK